MTLEEAIKHCNEVACKHNECAMEHKQLAQWLTELKGYKEQKPVDKNEIEIPFVAKDSELQETTYYIPKGFYAEIDGDKVVIKNGEKPTAWSEENETIASALSQLLKDCESENGWNCVYYNDREVFFVDMENWLKSLRPQAWKPSDEQMNALDAVLVYNPPCSNKCRNHLITLYNELKKLKA